MSAPEIIASLVEKALSALHSWQAMDYRKHAGPKSTICGSL